MIVVGNDDRIRKQSAGILIAEFLQQALEKVRSLVSAKAHANMLTVVGHRAEPVLVRPRRGAAKWGAIGRSPAQRKMPPPARNRYSSELTGCVSSSTTNWRAREKIRCRRPGGSSGGSEKKKSTRPWRRASMRSAIRR